MSKYKVGDKVRIVSEWGDGCRQNSSGRMDKWLGKTMTIRTVTKDYYDETAYRMAEDYGEHIGEGWMWNEKCIAGIANKFNVGERYYVSGNIVTENGNIIEITKFDTICGFNRYTYKTIDGNAIGVEWFYEDSNFAENLIPYTEENEKIIIIRDGQKVTARKYVNEQLVNSAIAKCHPDDTFDFDTGARIAFERLLGVSKEEHVVLEDEASENFCIKSSSQSNEIRIGKYILSIREDDNHVYN